MPEATELERKVLAVHRCLTGADLPHAIGGAVALGVYAAPRPTVDIDVNVFVGAERKPEVRAALAPLGEGEHPVHLFFSEDELHEAMRVAGRELRFGGETIPLVAPEHLVVRKALIGREKDWDDIEAILATVDPLDLAEIESWLERLGDASAQAGFAALIAARRR
jgi:hypothetical protein